MNCVTSGECQTNLLEEESKLVKLFGSPVCSLSLMSLVFWSLKARGNVKSRLTIVHSFIFIQRCCSQGVKQAYPSCMGSSSAAWGAPLDLGGLTEGLEEANIHTRDFYWKVLH